MKSEEIAKIVECEQGIATFPEIKSEEFRPDNAVIVTSSSNLVKQRLEERIESNAYKWDLNLRGITIFPLKKGHQARVESNLYTYCIIFPSIFSNEAVKLWFYKIVNDNKKFKEAVTQITYKNQANLAEPTNTYVDITEYQADISQTHEDIYTVKDYLDILTKDLFSIEKFFMDQPGEDRLRHFISLAQQDPIKLMHFLEKILISNLSARSKLIFISSILNSFNNLPFFQALKSFVEDQLQSPIHDTILRYLLCTPDIQWRIYRDVIDSTKKQLFKKSKVSFPPDRSITFIPQFPDWYNYASNRIKELSSFNKLFHLVRIVKNPDYNYYEIIFPKDLAEKNEFWFYIIHEQYETAFEKLSLQYRKNNNTQPSNQLSNNSNLAEQSNWADVVLQKKLEMMIASAIPTEEKFSALLKVLYSFSIHHNKSLFKFLIEAAADQLCKPANIQLLHIVLNTKIPLEHPYSNTLNHLKESVSTYRNVINWYIDTSDKNIIRFWTHKDASLLIQAWNSIINMLRYGHDFTELGEIKIKSMENGRFHEITFPRKVCDHDKMFWFNQIIEYTKTHWGCSVAQSSDNNNNNNNNNKTNAPQQFVPVRIENISKPHAQNMPKRPIDNARNENIAKRTKYNNASVSTSENTICYDIANEEQEHVTPTSSPQNVNAQIPFCTTPATLFHSPAVKTPDLLEQLEALDKQMQEEEQKEAIAASEAEQVHGIHDVLSPAPFAESSNDAGSLDKVQDEDLYLEQLGNQDSDRRFDPCEWVDNEDRIEKDITSSSIRKAI